MKPFFLSSGDEFPAIPRKNSRDGADWIHLRTSLGKPGPLVERRSRTGKPGWVLRRLFWVSLSAVAIVVVLLRLYT